MQSKIDFIGGNTRRCLIAMFLNMAYNLVDSLWIENLLGETAYAALTSSTPIILILNSLAMGMTNGTAILLSHAIGAKEQKKTESIIATSLILSILLALGITAGLEFLLKPLLALFKTPAETYQMAYGYLSIYLLGYLAVYLYCYFTAVLRSFGNVLFQMAAMLVCTLLNAVLDPLLIHFMGFTGAAVATVLSQTACLIFMLLYLVHKKLFTFHISAFQKNTLHLIFQKECHLPFSRVFPLSAQAF